MEFASLQSAVVEQGPPMIPSVRKSHRIYTTMLLVIRISSFRTTSYCFLCIWFLDNTYKILTLYNVVYYCENRRRQPMLTSSLTYCQILALYIFTLVVDLYIPVEPRWLTHSPISVYVTVVVDWPVSVAVISLSILPWYLTCLSTVYFTWVVDLSIPFEPLYLRCLGSCPARLRHCPISVYITLVVDLSIPVAVLSLYMLPW
jgi:Na+/melibiose symporter-like transporter